MTAVIGPSISKKIYEVKEDFKKSLLKKIKKIIFFLNVIENNYIST